MAQLIERFPGEVSLEKLIQVRHFDYNGHVFDLQTTTGVMILNCRNDGNGIMAKNCRCTSVPVLRPPDDIANNPALQAAFRNADGDFAPDPAAYDRWFRRASEPRRRAAVGAGRYNAVRSRLPEGQRPEWGDFVTPDGKLVKVETLRRESEDARLARRAEVSVMMRRQENYIRQVARQGFIES